MIDRGERGGACPTSTGVLVGAVLVAAGAGALFGYLITGTTQGTLLGALGIACFAGTNAVISVLRPALALALGVGAVVGFVGGVCVLGSLAAEQPGWIGGVVGAGIGVAEVLLGWWQRGGTGMGGADEQRGPAELSAGADRPHGGGPPGSTGPSA